MKKSGGLEGCQIGQGGKAWQQDSLADEQQVNLCRVDQVDVGQSVHPLQTRVDPTIQLITYVS